MNSYFRKFPFQSTYCTFILFFVAVTCFSQKPGVYEAIHSGVPVFDDRGINIRAHGANMVKEKGRFYLFGEAHSDTSNAFEGFNCYSSTDLYNWKFERVALPVQDTGRLARRSVGERVKVMRCPTTGEYIMFMHTDNMAYKDQCVGYAVSKAISGPYRFVGPLLFNGKPIRKWDMGAFQDLDGSGYILIHGGEIYKLKADYKGISEQVMKGFTSGFESPAIFRKGNMYYWLGSNLTSWERNDNYYYTSNSLYEPWFSQGLFAPKGTSTWNSQTTFLLPLKGEKDTTYLFMGDRWSYPLQASAATYVWQPLIVNGTKISMPTFQESWKVDLKKGVWTPVVEDTKIVKEVNPSIKYVGDWKKVTINGHVISQSDTKGSIFLSSFTGRQVTVYGRSGPQNGYALVEIADRVGKKVFSSIIDNYFNYEVNAAIFKTPVMRKGVYTIKITVMGIHSAWSDKRHSDYGSKGNFVMLDRLEIKE